MPRALPRRLAVLATVLALILSACGTAPSDRPSQTTPPPRTLLVDTDVAPDDLVALAFLLSAPGVDVAAITVSGTGEAHCAAGVGIVLGLLERLDAPEIPVACGRESPLAGNHAFPEAWRAGADGGSGLDLPDTERVPFDGNAIGLIAEVAAKTDGLSILTLGPLTNLAEALLADPSLVERIGLLYVMGGALHVAGNIQGPGAPTGNAVAEWNIYVDPRAAAIVVELGVEPRFVSLDGTNQVPVTKAFAQRVASEATGPAAQILADLFAANPFMTDGSYYLWDPLAAELAAGYEVGTFSPATVSVEEAEGPESGFTRPTDGSPNVQYLSDADQASAEHTLLRILNGP
ncbi:MAG: nucleoside hydrolase [Chloroflexota bacterium]